MHQHKCACRSTNNGKRMNERNWTVLLLPSATPLRVATATYTSPSNTLSANIASVVLWFQLPFPITSCYGTEPCCWWESMAWPWIWRPFGRWTTQFGCVSGATVWMFTNFLMWCGLYVFILFNTKMPVQFLMDKYDHCEKSKDMSWICDAVRNTCI